MKRILMNNLKVNTAWSRNLASLCHTANGKFLSTNFMKNVAWKLVPNPFQFSSNPLQKEI